MWLDSLKAAGYSTNTLNTRRCQMSALSRALGGDPRDVEGDDLLAHFAGKEWKCLCSMVLRPVERLVFSPKER